MPLTSHTPNGKGVVWGVGLRESRGRISRVKVTGRKQPRGDEVVGRCAEDKCNPDRLGASCGKGEFANDDRKQGPTMAFTGYYVRCIGPGSGRRLFARGTNSFCPKSRNAFNNTPPLKRSIALIFQESAAQILRLSPQRGYDSFFGADNGTTGKWFSRGYKKLGINLQDQKKESA